MAVVTSKFFEEGSFFFFLTSSQGLCRLENQLGDTLCAMNHGPSLSSLEEVFPAKPLNELAYVPQKPVVSSSFALHH